jgi:ATP-dependent DNA helicase RecQ
VLASLAGNDADALCGPFRRKYLEYTGDAPSAECLTRFLCGISVPLFTKLKARQIKGFAEFEAYPYAQVREWLLGFRWP